MSADQNAPSGYKIKKTKKTIDYVMVTMEAGATIPAHTHQQGYVVYAKSPGKLKKSTHRPGQPVKEEEIALVPGKPYYVAALAQDVTITVRNIGHGPIVYGKLMDPYLLDDDFWNIS